MMFMLNLEGYSPLDCAIIQKKNDKANFLIQ